MPFNSKNASEYGKKGGRKGYSYELAQVVKMRGIFSKDLALVEKVLKSKELTDREKVQLIQSRALKYADKLHASKTEMDLSGEITKKIVSVDE